MDTQFTQPEARAFFDALASRATVVTIDRRGTGMSGREVEDVSAPAESLDVLAVADAAGLGRFPLFADATAANVSAEFTGTHPERVERLILWNPILSNADSSDAEWAQAIRSDWSFNRRVWAGRVYPEGPVSMQRWFGSAMKQSVSAEIAARRIESHSDPRSRMGNIRAPTLVLTRDRRGRSREFGIHLASLLENGETRFVSGLAPTLYPDHEAVVETTFEFFGITAGAGDVTTDTTPSSATHSGTAVILFADIVDSTALTESLGDASFRKKARDLDTALRKVIRDNGGTPIEGKLLGDGVLATFSSASQAITAALACGRAGDDGGFPLHLGLHAGDVIREDNNVFGGAVNVAARISGLSAPGEVLVSDTVRSLARTSAGVAFEDRGEQALKGVGEAVRVWAVV
jgi:class 3 adenylate cyclase